MSSNHQVKGKSNTLATIGGSPLGLTSPAADFQPPPGLSQPSVSPSHSAQPVQVHHPAAAAAAEAQAFAVCPSFRPQTPPSETPPSPPPPNPPSSPLPPTARGSLKSSSPTPSRPSSRNPPFTLTSSNLSPFLTLPSSEGSSTSLENPPTIQDACYDVIVDIPFPLHKEMSAHTEKQEEIQVCDEVILASINKIHKHLKRIGISQSPVEFINALIASQSGDLKLVAGEAGCNADKEQRADFYDQPGDAAAGEEMAEAADTFRLTSESTNEGHPDQITDAALHKAKLQDPNPIYIQLLRAVVDGLVSTTSLMMGVSAIEGEGRDMILSGVAGLFSGASSMAIGELLSVYWQREMNSKRKEAAGREGKVLSLVQVAVARRCCLHLGRQCRSLCLHL